MLTELLNQLRRYDMLAPGDRVVCAVSGGADSMALLWGMYLLREKLDITLSAAHFNHGLRGEESDRDERFVAEFCHRFEIPLHLGKGSVQPGKKGLEAAARDARYGFLQTLPGKLATAHTADDNAETVLMHLVRGTGLKGLGGIAPVSGRVIRPLLSSTRQQVLAFLKEYHISYVEDSSNAGDAFLRNRLRHHVMPLLKQENPRLAENMSAMAMCLREDAQTLEQLTQNADAGDVEALRAMPPALRSRALEQFLRECGVIEPERAHIALAESLVFSGNPSAEGQFPGGVTVRRVYGRLERAEETLPLPQTVLPVNGTVVVGTWRVSCTVAEDIVNTDRVFTVVPAGQMILRSRQGGDAIRLSGGTKSVKKLLIDRKIPAAQRGQIPVVADETGILGVYGFGADLDRVAKGLPALQIRIESL